eukprot:4011472-Amphidinium_carterae.1
MFSPKLKPTTVQEGRTWNSYAACLQEVAQRLLPWPRRPSMWMLYATLQPRFKANAPAFRTPTQCEITRSDKQDMGHGKCQPA